MELETNLVYMERLCLKRKTEQNQNKIQARWHVPVISVREVDAGDEEFKASLDSMRLCHQTKPNKDYGLGLVGKVWFKIQGQSGQIRDSVSK